MWNEGVAAGSVSCVSGFGLRTSGACLQQPVSTSDLIFPPAPSFPQQITECRCRQCKPEIQLFLPLTKVRQSGGFQKI